MRFVAALVALLLPSIATAQTGYWRVVNVAADDTLNVRADPSASALDIGDLPHDAAGIEVAGTDPSGKWGRIVWEESNGWIAMRFLAPDPVQRLSGTELPAGLLCSGTEPFWSMQFSVSSATYSALSGALHTMALQGSRVASGRLNFPVQTGFSGADAAANVLIGPAACGDGMSDRVYPWRADLLLTADGAGQYLVGCCHLPLDVGSH